MERIVDKLLIRYNPDEILDYILLKTAAFAKLNARISVITEKKEVIADAVPVVAVPIVVAEEKAEGGTTSQSEDARRAAGNAPVEAQKVEEGKKEEEGKKPKKVVKKKAKEGESPAAAPAEEQKSEEEAEEKEDDAESEGSTKEKKSKKMEIDPNSKSKCKDPYKNNHLHLIAVKKEELKGKGINPKKNLTVDILRDCIENKKMSAANVAEEYGCPDAFVSGLMEVNNIVSPVSKNQQMAIARNRGAM
jgi:hypothetical protein